MQLLWRWGNPKSANPILHSVWANFQTSRTNVKDIHNPPCKTTGHYFLCIDEHTTFAGILSFYYMGHGHLSIIPFEHTILAGKIALFPNIWSAVAGNRVLSFCFDNNSICDAQIIFGGRWQHILGESELWERMSGVDISFTPASFGQANLQVFLLFSLPCSISLSTPCQVIKLLEHSRCHANIKYGEDPNEGIFEEHYCQ